MAPVKRVDWAAYRDRLGKVSDSVIAAEAGCSREAVRRARGRLGIAESNQARERALVVEAIAAEGEVVRTSAQAVAARLGVSIRVVFNIRRELGVRRYLITDDPSMHGRSARHYAAGCRCEPCRRYNADRALRRLDKLHEGKPRYLQCPSCSRWVHEHFTRPHVDPRTHKMCDYDLELRAMVRARSEAG